MWPLASSAQQGPLPVIGFLSSRSPASPRRLLQPSARASAKPVMWSDKMFRLIIDGPRVSDRLPALAVELVDLRVGVILAAGGPPSALAAKATTSAIPIVFSAASDPVALGPVASLDRPGGNRYRHEDADYAAGGKGHRTFEGIAACRDRDALIKSPIHPIRAGRRDSPARHLPPPRISGLPFMC